jgi:hypothetical protein
MNFQEMTNDVVKWFKIRKNMYGILAWIFIIFLLAGDFHYWAGAIETVDGKTIVPPPPQENVTVEGDYTVAFETLGPTSGSFTFGRPNTEDDSDLVPFEVKENAAVIYINLTADGSGARSDLDLYILDPSGKVQGSSASPEASEAAVVDAKSCKRGGAGTWNAKVDPYTGFNLQYTLDVTIGYKIYENESCDDGGVCLE